MPEVFKGSKEGYGTCPESCPAAFDPTCKVHRNQDRARIVHCHDPITCDNGLDVCQCGCIICRSVP